MCFIPSSVYMSIPISQFIPPSPLSPLVSIRFFLCVCVSISALQIRSSIPFFQIPHQLAFKPQVQCCTSVVLSVLHYCPLILENAVISLTGLLPSIPTDSSKCVILLEAASTHPVIGLGTGHESETLLRISLDWKLKKSFPLWPSQEGVNWELVVNMGPALWKKSI